MDSHIANIKYLGFFHFYQRNTEAQHLNFYSIVTIVFKLQSAKLRIHDSGEIKCHSILLKDFKMC